MTQKRGLGRGLGALIPGAGAAPAPEQALRTRTHPRTAPEAGERGASSRPVDMFFSGDPVQGEEQRPQRAGTSRLELADGMARAAAQRRGRGTTARKGRAAAEEEPTDAAAEPAKPAGRKSGTAKSAGAGKKTATAKAPGGAKKPSASQGRKATAPAGTATAAPKAAETSSEAGAAQADAAAVARDESPVVDIEEVELTPAREAAQSGAPTESPEKADETAAESKPTDEASETAESADADQPGVGGTSAPADAAAEGAEPTQTGTEDEDDAQGADGEASSEIAAGEQSQQVELMPVPGTEFAEIPIHEIRENPRNPRTMFDDDELDELAYSLREVGVLQPVVVRPIRFTEAGESFELVMGERRWRAAQRAGLASIPAIIRETSDDDLLRDALLENLHRSQLNPLEEAAAYQQLLEDFGCTQDELAERIGRSRPQVSNTLRLMRLPALVQRRLASGALSAGHARALLSLEDPALMEELAQRIVAEGLSVRAVERLVSRGTQPTQTRTPRRSTYDPHVVDITSRLSKSLEAPVRIDVGKRKGRITLEFTNLDDLERLVQRIGLEMPETEDELADVED